MMGEKCVEIEKACAEPLFCSLNLLFQDVLVGIFVMLCLSSLMFSCSDLFTWAFLFFCFVVFFPLSFFPNPLSSVIVRWQQFLIIVKKLKHSFYRNGMVKYLEEFKTVMETQSFKLSNSTEI